MKSSFVIITYNEVILVVVRIALLLRAMLPAEIGPAITKADSLLTVKTPKFKAPFTARRALLVRFKDGRVTLPIIVELLCSTKEMAPSAGGFVNAMKFVPDEIISSLT